MTTDKKDKDDERERNKPPKSPTDNAPIKEPHEKPKKYLVVMK